MPSPKDQSLTAGRTAAGGVPRRPLSAEVIGELEISGTLAHLESRLESLELDLIRLSGSREEESRRVAGELSVMKARVEDALGAIIATAEELRSAWVSLDKRVTDRVETRLSESRSASRKSTGTTDAGLRFDELAARLRGEIEAVDAASLERATAATELVDQAEARLDARMQAADDRFGEVTAQIEGRAAEILATLRLDLGRARTELQSSVDKLRDEASARERLLAERIEELTGAVEMLSTRLRGTDARRSGQRASADAAISSLASEVSSLETRMRESLDALSAGEAGRLGALEGEVQELRRVMLRLVETVGGAAVYTRRLSDLELRVAEIAARPTARSGARRRPLA